jgi:23S rRNA pseudouridine2605 synthase
MSPEMRLNKFLAHAGVCSRREADRWIAEGRVSVNGRAVLELGEKIDPARDRVQADGRPVRAEAERPLYVLLHKPAGLVVSVKDPFGRPTVMDLLKHLPARVYPVGRLDLDTEGVLLLTNDGDLALRLTHPRYGVAKIYEVRVEGAPGGEVLDGLRRGVFLEGRRSAPARALVLRRGRGDTTLKVEIHEGRKREIRKLFEAVGFPVVRLVRTEFAGLTLDELKPGQWRHLRKAEVDRLKKLADADPARQIPPLLPARSIGIPTGGPSRGRSKRGRIRA